MNTLEKDRFMTGRGRVIDCIDCAEILLSCWQASLDAGLLLLIRAVNITSLSGLPLCN